MTATIVGITVLFWAAFVCGYICARHDVHRLRRELRREREHAALRRTLESSPFGPVQLFGIDGGQR